MHGWWINHFRAVRAVAPGTAGDHLGAIPVDGCGAVRIARAGACVHDTHMRPRVGRKLRHGVGVEVRGSAAAASAGTGIVAHGAFEGQPHLPHLGVSTKVPEPSVAAVGIARARGSACDPQADREADTCLLYTSPSPRD